MRVEQAKQVKVKWEDERRQPEIRQRLHLRRGDVSWENRTLLVLATSAWSWAVGVDEEEEFKK
jgi:hypothetical protein